MPEENEIKLFHYGQETGGFSLKQTRACYCCLREADRKNVKLIH